MMAAHTEQRTLELRIERVIRAPRERVFEAFVNPDDLRRWSAPEGAEVMDGSSDVRVGGKWSVVMNVAAQNRRYHAEGVYREIKRPERLVYTHYWLTDHPPVETLITITFEDLGDSTRVVMVHAGFQSMESRDGHFDGWRNCFDQLERLLA